MSLFKEVSVFYMCQLGWEEDGEAWKWRCKLFAWEREMVGNLCLLLQNVNLQVDKDDSWKWHLETSNAFSVRSAYKVLAARFHSAAMELSKSLWHKDIPLKVVLFGWRLFRDRLPTKDNLLRRGVIDFEERLCVGGCGVLETSSHLSLHCGIFGAVWHFIHNWLGVC